jgi:hypothetical protein
MTTRTQRQTKVERFTTDASGDVTTYEPGLLKFTVGLYPALGSGYPDLPALELPLRSLFKEAPTRNPISAGWRQRREINNEIHTAFVLHFDPILPLLENENPGGAQLYSVVLNSKNDIVYQVQTPFADMAGVDHLDYIFDSWHFERNAKKVPAANIKTQILPVNELELSHEFIATVAAAGFNYQHRGNVSDLRRRGLLGGKADWFQTAWTWTVGNDTALIVVDSDKNYWTMTMIDGRTQPAQKTSTLKTALSDAKRQLNAN